MDPDEDLVRLEVAVRHVDRGEARVGLTWHEERTDEQLQSAAFDLLSTVLELHRTTLRGLLGGEPE